MNSAKKLLSQTSIEPSGKTALRNFSPEDKEIIYRRAEKLTGTAQSGRYRKEVILSNIERRMHDLEYSNVNEYLDFAEQDESERQHLISSLTIHTTSWFRELHHYNKIEKLVREHISEFLERPLTIYCSACSTGEEVYSFALVCEKIKETNPKFDYRITGHDIDPISINKGKKAIYNLENATEYIPRDLQKYMMIGSGKTEGLFTFDKSIRERCQFDVGNLRERPTATTSYDIVVCRNALIYFEPNVMNEIVENLLVLLKFGGLFVVGTSDFIDAKKNNLTDLGKSIHVVTGQEPFESKYTKPKILVIDDSLTMRTAMSRLLQQAGFRVESAGSAGEASEFLRREKVSLVTLDLHMPGMDGPTWLKQQRASGMTTPVVIISGADPSEAKAVLNALGNGAQDYFEKESLRTNPNRVVESLSAIIETYQNRRNKKNKPKLEDTEAQQPKLKISPKRPNVVLLGASTGGTEALIQVLERIPANCPPIVVVQHINAAYAKAFHERLCRASNLKMAEATNGLVILPGTIYMAHTDNHIEVQERGDDLRIRTSHMAPINSVRPSVDCLFKSAAFLGNRACGILLTGMGRDGAQGLLDMKKKGAYTMAQDEESCVVFGMPKAAIQLGAASVVGNLDELRSELKAVLASGL